MADYTQIVTWYINKTPVCITECPKTIIHHAFSNAHLIGNALVTALNKPLQIIEYPVLDTNPNAKNNSDKWCRVKGMIEELYLLDDEMASYSDGTSIEDVFVPISCIKNYGMCKGNIEIVPGYDGEYGEVKIFKDGEEPSEKQLSFF